MRRSFLLLCIGISLFSSCVIVKHGDKTADKKKGLDIYFANDSFDAKTYVDKMWDTKLIPYVKQNAVDLKTLMGKLKIDETGTSKQFGKRQVAEGAPFNFVAKGEAVILSVDISSRAGTAQLDLDGDKKSDALLQIGPVFKGSSIRDALPFISFDDFVNQLDYAALSNEINARVRDFVYKGFDPLSAVGKKISFYGFFTYESGSPVVITPVLLEWK
jgi:predicted lipoprotein